ncbi:flagellar assembly peptidoglycan hydrolase FlgJ [Azomonas macrocytogenes]|uniref:Peptidoglycan hydrolase FlgJ n=1 Tax=Azomonas macrocytogenes TaxID=69962 RepID=A0A839TA14_AZOMA|nr:flagellar assembly peptidoglycan hydrolase FlgJ [Azomonas macrocytogenes]MBB3105004.1 flagellar protein FlgJ [Azomonas macrocytogenes]
MDSRLGGTYASQADSGAFTDINRLARLKGKDRDSAENVKQVAQEFESLFLNQMLKSMRSANEALADKDSPFSSDTVKQYQDMYDQQMSLSLSRDNGGIGLAGVLERQMSKTGNRVGRTNPFAQVAGAQAVTDSRNAVATGAAPGNALPTDKIKSAGPALSAARPLNAVDPGRDDSSLINRRRLALPGTLSQRIAAGILPDSAASPRAASIAEQIGSDWKHSASGNPFDQFAAGRYRVQQQSAGSERAATVAATANKTGFGNKEAFINTMLPMAEAAAKRIGVDPRYLVAQAALETGWGKHMARQSDGSNSNNLFGIKAHGWKGASANAVTREYVNGRPVMEKAGFRAYASYADSFHDYVSFLQSNDRYREALDTGGNSERFMRELQKAGYATDPQYASKVNRIARGMDTYQSIQTLASRDNRITRS